MFDRIAQTLGAGAPAPRETRTRTQRMRDALTAGPLTAAQLGALIDRPAGCIRAYLKGDLACGRLLFDGKRYAVNPSFEPMLDKRVRDAVALLRSLGYTVSRK